MKASAAVLPPGSPPARIVRLVPEAFVSTWRDRPVVPVAVGLRRLSDDEQMRARAAAMTKADRFHAAVSHEDDVWVESFNQALMQAVLSYALTSAADVVAPFWQHQAQVLPNRLSEAGMTRLWEELEMLTITAGTSRPEATEAEVLALARDLASGALFHRALCAVVHDDPDVLARLQARRISEIRKAIAHVIELSTPAR